MLSQPKSFTRKDFQPLQQTYRELLSTIRASTPVPSLPATPLLDDADADTAESEPGSTRQSLRRVTIQTGPPQTYFYPFANEQTLGGYWNEYDNGSENGEERDDYVLYLNHDESGSPDLKSILHALTMPFAKARSWVKGRQPERQSLLSRHSSDSSYGAVDEASSPPLANYFTNPPGRLPPSRGNDSSTAVETDADEDADVEMDYSSSEEFPAGYAAHYAAALPSVSDQRMDMYRDRVTFMATSGLFAVAFLLLGIATVLVFTGRHKLRVEVDAAATLGSVVSIGCGCTALAMVMARWEGLALANKAVVCVTFTTVCVLNGMLLLLVAGNTSL